MDLTCAPTNEGKPSLSLVMTVYNCASFLRESLSSVFAQDYDGPMELIIIDDASTDASRDVLKDMVPQSPMKVKTVFLKQNRGVSGATQAGWDLATGDWIIMIDGDDVQMPDRCTRTAEIVTRFPEAGLICMSRVLVDEAGHEYARGGYGLQEYEQCSDLLYLKTPSERYLNCVPSPYFKRLSGFGCAMAFNRRVLTMWGPLWRGVETERFAQDPTWELRALLSFPVVGSKVLACRYRSHSGNLLNRTFHTEDAAEWLRQRELMMSHFYKMDTATHRQMLRDLDRADAEEGLCDWSVEQRSKLRTELMLQLASREMCESWWEVSWFERARRVFHYRKRVSANFSRWAWPRLLPLRLFCHLKTRLKQK